MMENDLQETEMTDRVGGFYVLGGTLPRDARSYVVRHADTELHDALRRGQFCYVLTSRQMGKSSLMVRTATRLRQERITCIVLDLTSIGQNLTEEQWYDGLLARAALQLDLEDELDEFWISHPRLGPLQRWMQALKSVILARVPGRIVLFIDEIDAVRSLPFQTDEFFAAIRECYNRRTEDPEFERLTFCLLGVATPADLIRETRSTPFNIGVRIELTDFTPQEAAPLKEGLLFGCSGVRVFRCSVNGNAPSDGRQTAEREQAAEALLSRVLYWTGGHPYLTQRLCQAVSQYPNTQTPELLNTLVDSVCRDLFLSATARNRDDNLLFVRERLLRGEADRAGLLDVYGRVLAGRRVKNDETNPLLGVLRLAGIVREDRGSLRMRNRIYEHVFDREWIRVNMPDAELRRQKMAYQRGFIRAAALSVGFMAITGGLAWTAIQESGKAHRFAAIADAEKAHALWEAGMAREYLYGSNMGLAQQAWAERNYGRVRELLEECRPKVGQADYRGFEWWLLWSRCHLDLPFIPCGFVGSIGFSTDGGALRTSDGHGHARFWDAHTGNAVQERAGRSYDIHYSAETGVGNTERSDPGHQNEVSPDGRYRAVGRFYWSEDPEYRNASVRLLDAHTGATLHTFKGVMAAFAFSPDSKMLATQGISRDVLIWDTATGALVRTLYGAVGPMAFSPDGAQLAAESYAYGDDGVKIYDVANSREPHRIPGSGDWATGSADGRMLATVDVNGAGFWQGVTVRDAQTERPLRRFSNARVPMALSPTGDILATGAPGNNGFNGLVSLWDTATGRSLGQLKAGTTVEPTGIVFSPDGKSVAVEAGGVKIWDITTRRERFALPRAASAPAFSPDSRLLAVAENSPPPGEPAPNGAQRVTLYDIATGKPVRSLAGAQAPIAFSPNRPWLVTGAPDNTLHLWNGATGLQVAGTVFKGLRSTVHTCAFSPDGQSLAAGDSSAYNVILWDAVTGRETFHIPGRTDRTDVASYSLFFSRDGARLYSGNQDDVVKVWEAVPRRGARPLALLFSAPTVIQTVIHPFGQQ